MVFELIHNDRILALREATEEEINQLQLTFTRKSANYRFDRRYKLGHWDGNISYFRNNQFLPAGLWRDVVDMCKEFNYSCKIIGIERKFDRSITREEFDTWVAEKWKDSPIKPYDYQISTAYDMLRTMNCVGELATSSGKTWLLFIVLSYLLDKKKSNNILIIVPQVDLVIQTTEDFYEYNEMTLKMPIQIQQLYTKSQHKADSHVCISTWQSLINKPIDFFDKFDTILVDETHGAKATSIKTILERCQYAVRRYGVTGTLPKKESLDRMTITAYLGPSVATIRADYLMDRGIVTRCKINIIKMQYAPVEIRESFQRIYNKSSDDRKRVLKLEQQYMQESQIRLQFITDLILRSNKNTLLLFHRIAYGEAIYNTLRQKTERRVMYIDGQVDIDLRGEFKDVLESQSDVIMVASFGTFKQGINVKNIHVIGLMESYKSDVFIRQSIGRGLRKHPDKKELIVIDFVDDFSIGSYKNYLVKHSDARKEIYNEQNFPYTTTLVDLNTIYNSSKLF